ncbi:hypothetical protein SKAU_G00182880 [Synaphobranchus kaupii]|uniref:Amidohydrolase-related domain-containing protein n=1 Tax=Synaphobranchus kaupii TaxID=118154 RepID=A0A9Q1IVK0_SYNKA|nr:hypothetical protein SKAU_G00182880 [Synaphobranchus kaupii]
MSVTTQVQGGDFNLYENLRCHGVPLVTISRGRVVCENGVFMCAEGSGKFYPLRTFPDFLYKKMVQREKCQALKAVERAPYIGDVALVHNSGKKESGPSDGDTPTRPCTRHGGMRDLHDDTLNVVASDHRPFTTKQKAMGKEDFTKIPHGVPGIQDRMSVIWERGVARWMRTRFVATTSSNAAKIYNLYPRKGRIIPGADADLVVWDPDATRTMSVTTQVQGGDFNLYENLRCHGVPLVTISRGRVVCENGVFMCAEGSGKFYPLRTFPDFLYKKMVQREKCQALKAVERAPYIGDVALVHNSGKKESGPSDGDTPTRPCTRHGGHAGPARVQLQSVWFPGRRSCSKEVFGQDSGTPWWQV